MLAHSTSIAKIAAKMVAVMADVPSLEKDSRNDAQKFDYTSADNVVATIRPILVKHGVLVLVSIPQSQTIYITKSDGKGSWSSTFTGEATFVDAESGEFLSVNFQGHSLDTGDKSLYKALTAALKYLLLQNFMMDRNGDVEVDANTQSGAGKMTATDVLYILAAGGGIVTTKSTTKVTEGKYRLEVNLPTPTGVLVGSVYARDLDFLTDRDAEVYTKLKTAPDGTVMTTAYPVVLKLGTLPSTGAHVPALDVESTNRYLLSLEENL